MVPLRCCARSLKWITPAPEGTLLNQKFTPQILEKDRGLDMLVQLVRTYFKLDGHHIQFNVVDADTLRAAKANPEAASRPDRACGRLQRLFLRPE